MLDVKSICVLLFLFVGCNHSSQIDPLCICPNIINIGRVNINDSPINISFKIQNIGKIPVVIKEITSDCSCTIVDSYRKTLEPNSNVNINVKLFLKGRIGNVENKLCVRIKPKKNIIVSIVGNVSDNIWFNGQKVFCRINKDTKRGEAIFSIFVKDYNNIHFYCKCNNNSIHIKELERYTISSNITQIKYQISMFDHNTDVETEYCLVLLPDNSSLLPLKIPITTIME